MRSLSEAILHLLGQALPGNASVEGKIMHCRLATGYTSATPSRSVWVQFVPDTMIPLHREKPAHIHTRSSEAFPDASHSKRLQKKHSISWIMPCCGGSQTQRWDTAPGAWMNQHRNQSKKVDPFNGPSLKVSFMISVRKFPPQTWMMTFRLRS